jgi:hypothetical protein
MSLTTVFAGEMVDSAGTGLLTVNVIADVVPPGAGVTTVTARYPAIAVSAAMN